MHWGVPAWRRAIVAVPRHMPLVLMEKTRDDLEMEFLGNPVFSLAIRTELQQVLFIAFTFLTWLTPGTR